MHGQFPRYLGKKLVDNEGSNRLPNFGDIKGETESKKMAAQNQAISTHYCKNRILEGRNWQ